MAIVEAYLFITAINIVGRILNKKVDEFIISKIEKKEISKLLLSCVKIINKSNRSYRKKLTKPNIKKFIYNPLILKEISRLLEKNGQIRLPKIKTEIKLKRLCKKILSDDELKELSNDLKNAFISNLSKYPELTRKFTISKLISIEKKVEDSPKKVLKIIKKQFDLRPKYSGWGLWDGIGIFRQEIIGLSAKSLVVELNKHYSFNGSVGFKKFVSKKQGLFEVNFTNTYKNISFEIDVEDILGDPYKVLVPNRKTIKIWIIEHPNLGLKGVYITYFSTDKEFISQISECIKNCLPAKCIFEGIVFDQIMKTLIKKFSPSIHILGVNPKIMEKIKSIDKRDKTINISKEIISSEETGLPKTEFGKRILNKIEVAKKGEVSDILYFKTKKTFIKKGFPLISMQVYRDGRIYSKFKRTDFPILNKKFEFFDEFLFSLKAFPK